MTPGDNLLQIRGSGLMPFPLCRFFPSKPYFNVGSENLRTLGGTYLWTSRVAEGYHGARY
jgi:hypothetical protein